MSAVLPARGAAQDDRQMQQGRFTVRYAAHDETLARALLSFAQTSDTFPGLPRPPGPVRIEIAANHEAFRRAIGAEAPEWGSAFAFPDAGRIVMQGSRAASDAGDPRQVLRHELAHVALYEYLGPRAPRWFDEGYASYAAGEWGRDEVLAANVALVFRGVPSFDSLEAGFAHGATAASAAYAFAYRAIVEMAALDHERGLARVLERWRQTETLDQAMRQSLGVTFGSFERDFRDRTRRRYGALGALADLALVSLVLLPAFIPLYVSRRRRLRAQIAAMRERERMAERLAESDPIGELLGSTDEKPKESLSPETS